MSGYDLVLKIKELEEKLHDLGFRWGHDKYGKWGHSSNSEFGNVVAVFPRDDELPIYGRDAQLFVGTIAQLDTWLKGVEWARGYDRMIKVSDEKKRQRKEQDERNRQLLKRIKTGNSEDLLPEEKV